MRPETISISELSRSSKPTIVIIREFRLGDIVAVEPIIIWLHKKYPAHQLAFAAHHNYVEALAAHPCLTYLVPINDTAEIVAASRNFPENIKTLLLEFSRPEWGELGNSLKRPNTKVVRQNYFFWDGLLGMISTQSGLPKLTSQPRFYIQSEVQIPFNLPDEYVVFHTSSQDPTKDWQPEKWLELADYFFSKGTTVVELGWTRMMYVDNPLFYNGTKLGLHQTAKIIEGAKCFFGIDSGLAHVANALEVDGVCLLGVLDRLTRYTRHIPYTGKYACGHIVRTKGLKPAAELTVDEVIKFYEAKNGLFARFKARCECFYISLVYNRFMRCGIIGRNQYLKDRLWRRKKSSPPNKRKIQKIKLAEANLKKVESWLVRMLTFFKKQACMRHQVEQLTQDQAELLSSLTQALSLIKKQTQLLEILSVKQTNLVERQGVIENMNAKIESALTAINARIVQGEALANQIMDLDSKIESLSDKSSKRSRRRG